MADEALPPAAPLPERPGWLGPRVVLLAAIALAGAVSAFALELELDALIPDRSDLDRLIAFLAQAASPAFSRSAADAISGAPPLLLQALEAALLTLMFALTALSLAGVVGIVLGFLASSAWWAEDLPGAASGFARRAVGPAVQGATRVLIAVMRSVHELVWAVLLLAAIGLNDLSAVIAIAIPYGGTLAKVWSEMIDESPHDASRALRALGAGRVQVFLFGLLPRALPDMAAYMFYRLECALRSSVVLGFFGWETLGYYVKLEWDAGDYAEVWTYLYTLLALIASVEWWSGRLRRRFVA